MNDVYFPTVFGIGLDKQMPYQPEEQNPVMFMTRNDWNLLLEKATTRRFRANDIIIERDSIHSAICVVDKGAVRIERERGVVLAEHGPGAVFGEMSFLENREASADVIAQVDTTIRVIQGMYVYGLMVSVPGFATRFYQTLAVVLARRLRASSEQLDNS